MSEAAQPAPAPLDPLAMIKQAADERDANNSRIETLKTTIKDAQGEIKTLRERNEILTRSAGAGTKRTRPKAEETPAPASGRRAGANASAPGFTPPDE
jgi:hypothetical protein